MMNTEQTETLIAELKKLNKNLENLPQLTRAINDHTLKIERYINLAPRR